MDSSIKKESDLPAADPSTPIPLKYEESGARAVEKEIALLLDRGHLQFSLKYFYFCYTFLSFSLLRYELI